MGVHRHGPLKLLAGAAAAVAVLAACLLINRQGAAPASGAGGQETAGQAPAAPGEGDASGAAGAGARSLAAAQGTDAPPDDPPPWAGYEFTETGLDARGEGVLVAAVQTASRLGEVEGNRRRLGALAARAADRGARIVVLPECAVPGYRSQDGRVIWSAPERMDGDAGYRSLEGAAETVPGPSTEYFGELARRLGIYVTAPIAEVAQVEGVRTYFNSLVLLGPDGTVRAHYRKLKPWPIAEHRWSAKGDRGLALADTEYGRLGLMICYDVHTVLPRLKAAGADAVLYAIAWVDHDPALWFEEHLPDRAARAGCHLICANWSVERAPDWRGYGFSRVIDRTGRVMARARTRTGDEIVYARLPLKSQ